MVSILIVESVLESFFILKFFKVFDAKQHSSVLHIFKQANFPVPSFFFISPDSGVHLWRLNLKAFMYFGIFYFV